MNNLEKQILLKINNSIAKEDIENIRDLFKKNGKIKSFDEFNTIYGEVLDMDVLQYVIHSNDTAAINQKELTYLLKKSDLKRYTQSGRYNSLFLLMIYNQAKNLGMNKGMWEYVIKNSDTKHASSSDEDALSHYIVYRKRENIKLNKETEEYLFSNYVKKSRPRVLWAWILYDGTIEILEKLLDKMEIKGRTDLEKMKLSMEIIRPIEAAIEKIERKKIIKEIEKLNSGKKGFSYQKL